MTNADDPRKPCWKCGAPWVRVGSWEGVRCQMRLPRESDNEYWVRQCPPDPGAPVVLWPTPKAGADPVSGDRR